MLKFICIDGVSRMSLQIIKRSWKRRKWEKESVGGEGEGRRGREGGGKAERTFLFDAHNAIITMSCAVGDFSRET